jgi:hypothetical protein
MMSLSSTHRRPMFYAKHEVMFCSSSDVASAKLVLLANLYVEVLLVAGPCFFLSLREVRMEA